MPLIASVYLNRLGRGMKLQCCATVRFALGSDDGSTTEVEVPDETTTTVDSADEVLGIGASQALPQVEIVTRPVTGDVTRYQTSLGSPLKFPQAGRTSSVAPASVMTRDHAAATTR